MISRNGVCYDLEISEYKSTQRGITYVFSSQLHKDKFESKLKTNRKTINLSLSKRFKFSIDVSTIADLVLYQKVETRGFLIEVKEDKLQCLNHIIYGGGVVMKKSSKER